MVLKVLNFLGTGKKGIFAEENRMPAIAVAWPSRQFSGRVAELWKRRGMIVLRRSTEAIEAGGCNAG
jgi:hypothetical protein